MVQDPIDVATIAGWGVDADPQNDPTYPMRERAGDDKRGMSWVRPAQQPTEVEILHSIERPNVTAVFGTSSPPSGVSGMIRRLAFKRSESKWSHWLLLMLADRINVVEGVFQDIGRGRFPNIFAEMGIRSELKFNRAGFIRKVAVAVIALVVIILIIALD
jgi:hypothetical protein